MTMRQNVVAGKARVGTKVEAILTIATLVKGTVIPMGATFSGEVVESAAKSRTAPSRLAIRMNSVHWKKGSAPIDVYLTAWYYPLQLTTEGDQSNDQPARPMGGSRRRQSSATVPSLPGRLPGSDFPGPSASVSENRAVMKEVESTHRSDGGLVLTSTRLNLKLDKTTTYVLATGDLMPGK